MDRSDEERRDGRPRGQPPRRRATLRRLSVVERFRDQWNAGGAGISSCRTNQTQEAWVYSHAGPIRRRKRGYVLISSPPCGSYFGGSLS
eukprot:9310321-Pyramimonas_sp.AAC.2